MNFAKKRKKDVTHNVPQAAPHWVVEMQCEGPVGLNVALRRVFGLDVNGVDVTGSGVSFCSLLDHLLLEPFHLKRNTQGDLNLVGARCSAMKTGPWVCLGTVVYLCLYVGGAGSCR